MKLAGLVEHRLLRPLEERDQRRWLFVTKEIEQLLRGGSAHAHPFPSAQADIVIARFCKGLIVSVTREAKVKSADFKWLKGHDEAWVLNFREPKPGWRLFGRFARKNVFVGLSCLPRHECGTWSEYNQCAADMIAIWKSRFPEPPFRSNKYDDYFSWPYDDKDEK